MWSQSTEAVRVDSVRRGDSLPDLGNGYVIDIEINPDLRSADYNTTIGEGLYLLTMHDADGEEFYLFAPGHLSVRVDRER
jgi:hypothetical protein